MRYRLYSRFSKIIGGHSNVLLRFANERFINLSLMKHKLLQVHSFVFNFKAIQCLNLKHSSKNIFLSFLAYVNHHIINHQL